MYLNYIKSQKLWRKAETQIVRNMRLSNKSVKEALEKFTKSKENRMERFQYGKRSTMEK